MYTTQTSGFKSMHRDDVCVFVRAHTRMCVLEMPNRDTVANRSRLSSFHLCVALRSIT